MHKQHPLGTLFPQMTAEEHEYLKADIQKHGQKEPILLLDGTVLDGWHRYRICLDLGIEPKVKTLGKKANALAEVISRNLARRQLSPGQRYGVLLKIAEEHPEVAASLETVRADAKKRQVGGVPQQRRRSSEAIGRMAGVSHATVERVDRLKRRSPEMFDEMVDGKATLADAIRHASTQAQPVKQDALCAPSKTRRDDRPGYPTPRRGLNVARGDWNAAARKRGIDPEKVMAMLRDLGYSVRFSDAATTQKGGD